MEEQKFEREPAEWNPKIVKSTCKRCHALAGASSDPGILEILEQAHTCSDEIAS